MKDGLDGIVKQLEDLLVSRASIFDAKITLTKEFSEKIDNEDVALKEDLIKFQISHDIFFNAAHSQDCVDSVY